MIKNNFTDKDLHLKYKLLRNKLTHTINKAKQKYYQKQLSTSTGDSKKTWNVINNIIGKNNKNSKLPEKLLYNDIENS